MKLKRQPEDFIVEEIADLPATGGPFSLYLLEKRSLGTIEALDGLRRRWNLDRKSVSYGGLKDRHAVTRQHVTVLGGPREGFETEHVRLSYLGAAAEPFKPTHIAANRFRIVMRSLDRNDVDRARRALAEAGRDGVPNYFDDQRFGSVGRSGEFIGKAWCLEDYERALWLALAAENDHDRPNDKKQKELLRRHWGDFPLLKRSLDRSNRRSIITFLVDRPGDFKGAFGRLDPELRGLWRNAFQSHVWNKVVAAEILAVVGPARCAFFKLRTAAVPFFGPLDESERSRLWAFKPPLPSQRMRCDDDAFRARIAAAVRAEGLELEQMRIRYPKDEYFSRGERDAVLRVDQVEAEDAADELYPGKRKLSLAFVLGRGSYATMVVKRITEAAVESKPADAKHDRSLS